MGRYGWGVLCLWLAMPAAATSVYVCEEGGRKVFSQVPCSATAQEVEIERPTRTVRIEPDMTNDDLSYFCSRVMQADEKARQDRRVRNTRYNDDYRHVRSYDSRRDDIASRQRDFVLSHVSNLTQLARDMPDVHLSVQEMAGGIFPGRYYGMSENNTSDVARVRAQRMCEERLGFVLRREAARAAHQARDYQRSFRR